MDLTTVYANRFPPADRAAREAVWQVLCRYFFQKYVSQDAVVLDLGAGFCEFLRYIQCRERIAVDLDEQIVQFAPEGARVIVGPAHLLTDKVADDSVDIVFASNFFEHLPNKDISVCFITP